MSQNPPAVYSITQNIPVADHVYKYLRKLCGTDHIEANRNSYVGSLVLSLQGRNYDVGVSTHKFTRIFKAQVNECYYSKTGMFITSENAQLFNDQIDKKFRDELYRYMIMNRHLEEKLFMKTMRAYLDFYDITEDDIKLDTLYRDFKRKKNDILDNFNLTTPAGTKMETSEFVPKKTA